jgi:hypothetical protein
MLRSLFSLFVFGAEALFGTLRQSLKVSQALFSPALLLAPPVGRQLLPSLRGARTRVSTYRKDLLAIP